MHTKQALIAAVAVADCLETYTHEAAFENIVRVADWLQASGRELRTGNAPQQICNWIDGLPREVVGLLTHR